MDVAPRRHVEVEMVGVAAVARANQASKDVAPLLQPCGKGAQEARVKRRSLVAGALARRPVFGDAYLERVAQALRNVRGQRLFFRRRSEVEANHVDGIAESVLAQAVLTVTRLTAAVGAVVPQAAGSSTVNLDRRL